MGGPKRKEDGKSPTNDVRFMSVVSSHLCYLLGKVALNVVMQHRFMSYLGQKDH